MRILLPLLVIFAASDVFADEDLRDKVRGEEQNVSNTIEPGKHIFGHAFGTTEDEFIKAEGKPDGYLKLSGHRTVMVYGRSHGYLFTDNKLTGVRITRHLLDWRLSNQMPYQQHRSEDDWIISNGVRAKMSKAELIKLLGDKLKTKGYPLAFEIDDCVIEVDTVRYSPEEREGREEIAGIYVQKKEG
jgi:ABC-type phosphate transport system auxiliary subunit